MKCVQCETDLEMEETTEFSPGNDMVEFSVECSVCHTVFHGILYRGYPREVEELHVVNKQ